MKDIKHIRRYFYSGAPGVGFEGTMGGQFVLPKVNQIWCATYIHEWHMQRHIILGPRPLGLREGQKGQISINLNYKVNFKDFKTKLCVSSHK